MIAANSDSAAKPQAPSRKEKRKNKKKKKKKKKKKQQQRRKSRGSRSSRKQRRKKRGARRNHLIAKKDSETQTHPPSRAQKNIANALVASMVMEASDACPNPYKNGLNE